MQVYTTPAKAGHNAGVALPSSARASTSNGMQSALYEPSPASTYGDTVAGESPATPYHIDDYEPNSALRRSLQLSSITEHKVEHSEQLTTSPKHPIYGISHARRSKLPGAVTSDRSRGVSLLQDTAGSSPAKLVGMLDDVSSLQTDFVVKSSSAKQEDPFTSPSWRNGAGHIGPVTPSRRNQTFAETPSRRVEPLVPLDDSPSTRSTTSKTNSKRKAVGVTSPFSPREDRLGQRPTPENAQAIFAPDACVFVANLPSACSDHELEHLVTNAFKVFGTVYVKIRRDGRGMPYAFCQYESKQAADKAIIAGKGVEISGRFCRTEIAKVQRALYVSRHDGREVKQEDVRKLLEPYGSIEKIFVPTETERELFQLPSGMWVRFAYFQDCRDAYAGLRDDSVFRFDQRQEPAKESPRPRLPLGRRTIPGHVDMKTSIFVGNLPPSITHDELVEVFGKYGVVSECQIICKSPRTNSKRSCFAFVEFSTTTCVQKAIDGENGRLNLHGHTVHVERKQPVHLDSQIVSPLRRNHRSLPNSPAGPLFWETQAAPQPILDYSQIVGTVPRNYAQFLQGQVAFPAHNGMAASSWQQRPEYNMREPIFIQHPYGHTNVSYGFSTFLPPNAGRQGNQVGVAHNRQVSTASNPVITAQSQDSQATGAYYLASPHTLPSNLVSGQLPPMTSAANAQQFTYSPVPNTSWVSYGAQDSALGSPSMHHGYNASKMSGTSRQY